MAARIAVGREPHDFILVKPHKKTEIQSKDAIKEPQRMQPGDLLDDVNFIALADGDGGAVKLAHAVGNENQGLIESTHVERACGVRQVMRNGD
ncbi:hypothetical protein D3C83_35740 [compost metagenome]